MSPTLTLERTVHTRGGTRKILWGANPWSDVQKNMTSSENGSTSASAPVAIATFVVIVVLVILGFGLVL